MLTKKVSNKSKGIWVGNHGLVGMMQSQFFFQLIFLIQCNHKFTAQFVNTLVVFDANCMPYSYEIQDELAVIMPTSQSLY